MNPKVKYRMIPVFCLIIALFLLALVSPMPKLEAQAKAAGSAQASPSGTVNVTTYIPTNYEFFSLNVPEYDSASVILNSLSLNSSVPISIVSSFKPSSVIVKDRFANGSVVSLPLVKTSGVFAIAFGVNLVLPKDSETLNLTMNGLQTGESLLWRDLTNRAFVFVETKFAISITYNTYLVTDVSSIIFQTFTPTGQQQAIPSIVSRSGGNVTYLIQPTIGTILLQSVWFLPVSIVITIVAALGLLLISFNLFLGKRNPIKRLPLRIPNFSLPNWIRKIDSKKLLTLFIMCSFLMISLAIVSGPDPSVRVYAVADPGQAARIQATLSQIVPNVVVVTPAQDYSDFGVMSSVGMFQVLVISNYTSFNLRTVSGFVVPNVQNVPIVIIDSAANSTLASQIFALHPTQILSVANSGNLAPETQNLTSLFRNTASTNILGLSVGITTFKLVLVAESVLSFVLVFLGFAFMGARFAEQSTELTLSRLAVIIAFGIFVFYFSEMTYVVTSSILRMPLSLHAVISGAKDITSVGLLGFGGGSTPRLLAGMAGFFIGALKTGFETRFGKRSLIFIGSLVVILIANPFAPGQYAFEGIMLFVGNVNLGSAYLSAITLKAFIYGIGAGVGGNVSPVYLLSAGKMFYFAALIPFAFLNKMSKTTASLTLITMLPILGHGAARIGEMTPDKTLIAIVPGMMTGFAIAFVLLVIASLEKYLTRNVVKS